LSLSHEAHSPRYKDVNEIRTTGLKYTSDVTIKTSVSSITAEEEDRTTENSDCSYQETPNKNSTAPLPYQRSFLTI